MQIINIAVLLFLGILSIMDIRTFNRKHEGIPSILTSAFMIIIFLYSFFLGKDIALLVYVSILAGLFALLCYEMELFSGLADIKVLIACGMSLNVIPFLFFILITSGVSVIYKSFVKWKFPDYLPDIPFIPVFLMSYLVNWWYMG